MSLRANETDAKTLYLQAMESQDRVKSRELFRTSAELGYWPAQLACGNLLEGEGLPGKAASFLKKAAAQGSIDAMNNLGFMASGQTGYASSYFQAFVWYRIGEIVSGEKSANIIFVSRNLTVAEIQLADEAAQKWVKDHKGIKRAIE